MTLLQLFAEEIREELGLEIDTSYGASTWELRDDGIDFTLKVKGTELYVVVEYAPETGGAIVYFSKIVDAVKKGQTDLTLPDAAMNHSAEDFVIVVDHTTKDKRRVVDPVPGLDDDSL